MNFLAIWCPRVVRSGTLPWIEWIEWLKLKKQTNKKSHSKALTCVFTKNVIAVYCSTVLSWSILQMLASVTWHIWHSDPAFANIDLNSFLPVCVQYVLCHSPLHSLKDSKSCFLFIKMQILFPCIQGMCVTKKLNFNSICLRYQFVISCTWGFECILWLQVSHTYILWYMSRYRYAIWYRYIDCCGWPHIWYFSKSFLCSHLGALICLSAHMMFYLRLLLVLTTVHLVCHFLITFQTVKTMN